MGEGEGAEPSRLTLWALRRHSTDRRSLHCLWQFTPQAGEGRKGRPARVMAQKALQAPEKSPHHTTSPHPQAAFFMLIKYRTTPSPEFLFLGSLPHHSLIKDNSLLSVRMPLWLQYTSLPGNCGHQNKNPCPNSNSPPQTLVQQRSNFIHLILPLHLRPCL